MNNNVVGNVYDKYHTQNPISRFLMQNFLDGVAELYRQVSPNTVLEVGCGEGYLVQYLLENAPKPEYIEACDLSIEQVPNEIKEKIRFREASIYELPYDDNSFELVLCCEVLEHLEHPEKGLAELARVAQKAVLLSTPNEPLWRILNLARGKYISALGNTPGHIQHFSLSSLVSLSETQLKIANIRSPIPWVILLGQPVSK